ncbi:MAG: DUF2892 domain-containing protein [Chloroflexota bacterium]|nr:DUF2892 domain-containing protein [Chloroflexota bacterium]
MGFITLMSGTGGRWLRAVAGLALIGAGLGPLQGLSGAAAGIVVAAVGLVPAAAGAFDLCIFAPLAGCSISGRVIRRSA